MKRCSTSLIIREMQIKTTVRYDLTPVRMATIKHLQTINTGEGVQQRGPSCTLAGNSNWYSHYGEQNGDFLKNTRYKTIISPRNPATGHISWENNNWKRHMYPNAHCSAI